ncbi:hypothetical protein TW73_08905 [Pseudoalteromonas piscicida]|nr:hypothetical protein TW73_08905 [Pseudoalteromonas piscicida]
MDNKLTLLITKLIVLSLNDTSRISVSVTTFPSSQAIDVTIYRRYTFQGKNCSELYEMPETIYLNDHSAITQIDRLLVKINTLYNSHARCEAA